LRGVSTLFGPFNVLFGAARVAVLPELVRSGGAAATRSWVNRLAVLVCAVVAGWAIGLTWLFPSLGTALLGQSWEQAQDIVPIIGLQYVALVWYQVGLLYLRASSATGLAMRIRLLQAFLAIALLVVGAIVWGVRGAAIGLAVSTVVAAAASMSASRRHHADAGTRGDRP
jgi:O-antigen/teichoic acid export membrane protein